MDGAVWVAVLTGTTAVLASWVTSQGNRRAATAQEELSARSQFVREQREARKAAYLDFMRQAGVTEELYFRLDDVLFPPGRIDQADVDAHVKRTRDALRDAFEPLKHGTRVVVLEGPAGVAECAEAVLRAAFSGNRRLYDLANGGHNPNEARARFVGARDDYRMRVRDFAAAASASMDRHI
ncbi:hypothetical protein [Microbispora sp. NPDC049125]|uniref:hypothetical protein n=1 Tax=Microbispora sp. NPDC049125 TaxID=3154929 RepID=UPI003467C3EE